MSIGSSLESDGAFTVSRQAHFKAMESAYDLPSDPDLDPLRRRADYIDLLWDLADGLPAK